MTVYPGETPATGELDYSGYILARLRSYLETNNKAAADEPRFVDNVKFTHNTWLSIQEASSLTEGDDALELRVFTSNRGDDKPDSLSEFLRYDMASNGTLYKLGKRVPKAETASIYSYIEKLTSDDGQNAANRRFAMRHRIAPPMIAAVLSGVDHLAEQSIEPKQLMEIATNEEWASVMFEWRKPVKDFKSVSEALFGIVGIMTLRTGYDESNRLVRSADPRLSHPTEPQSAALRLFTFAGDFERNITTTTDAQAEIVASIMLPAFLASRYSCRDRTELLDRLNRTSLREVYEIMRNPEFSAALEVLPLAPLGTLGLSVNRDALLSYELEFYEKNFEADETPIRPEGGVGFNIYNLFTQDEDGVPRLDPRYALEAHEALRLDIKEALGKPAADLSIGCPALIRTVKLESIDVSSDQLASMAELSGIEFSGDGSKNRLHFHHSVIQELHNLHTATLKQFINAIPGRGWL
jgi:hypothetical protein